MLVNFSKMNSGVLKTNISFKISKSENFTITIVPYSIRIQKGIGTYKFSHFLIILVDKLENYYNLKLSRPKTYSILIFIKYPKSQSV